MLRKGMQPDPQEPGGEPPIPSFKSSAPVKKDEEEKKGGLSFWSGGKKKGGWLSGSEEKLGGSLVRGRGAFTRPAILDRLKTLKKRDLVFIASGLAVLLMAPLAEFLLTSPEQQPGSLQSGFDRKGALFSESASPYEEGVAGIAPGGLPGQENDVITPLNVRDPSALVMGPVGAEKAPTAQPPAKKPEAPAPNFSDAIKEAGRKAVQKAPGLPRPSAKLAGALKDWAGVLSAARGGGGPTYNIPPPSSAGLFGKPRVATGLTRSQAIPGFRGGGRALAPGTGMGAPFGRPGASGGGVTEATGPGGLSGGGAAQGGAGGNPAGEGSKGGGGNTSKDSRSTTQGENLALLAQKLNLEQAIKLKWDKLRYDQLERKKMLEQMAAQTASQALLKILEGLLQKGKGGDGDKGGGGGDKGKGSPTPTGQPPGTAGPSTGPRTVPPPEGGGSNNTPWTQKPQQAIPAHRVAVQSVAVFQRDADLTAQVRRLTDKLNSMGSDAGLAPLKAQLQAAISALGQAKNVLLGDSNSIKKHLTDGLTKLGEANDKIKEVNGNTKDNIYERWEKEISRKVRDGKDQIVQPDTGGTPYNLNQQLAFSAILQQMNTNADTVQTAVNGVVTTQTGKLGEAQRKADEARDKFMDAKNLADRQLAQAITAIQQAAERAGSLAGGDVTSLESGPARSSGGMSASERARTTQQFIQQAADAAQGAKTLAGHVIGAAEHAQAMTAGTGGAVEKSRAAVAYVQEQTRDAPDTTLIAKTRATYKSNQFLVVRKPHWDSNVNQNPKRTVILDQLKPPHTDPANLQGVPALNATEEKPFMPPKAKVDEAYTAIGTAITTANTKATEAETKLGEGSSSVGGGTTMPVAPERRP